MKEVIKEDQHDADDQPGPVPGRWQYCPAEQDEQGQCRRYKTAPQIVKELQP